MNMCDDLSYKMKPSEDSYMVSEEVVHKEQADRLVQKALQRNKKK